MGDVKIAEKSESIRGNALWYDIVEDWKLIDAKSVYLFKLS